MRNTAIHILEMSFGAILLALGLFYLIQREKNLNVLVNAINDRMLETESMRQEYNLVDLSRVTDEALYIIVMGYREYPITIDGILIKEDENDYENYFTLIKDGIYQKNYIYDINHNIIQVTYTYMGL